MFFSQKDDRWKNKKLGTCTQTFGQVACFLTSIANKIAYENDVVYTPEELNAICLKKGFYSNGCMLNAAALAKHLGYSYTKETPGKRKSGIVIAETNHYKKLGVPQHFFLYNVYTDRRVDPLDLLPEFEDNTYPIVSLRVFEKIPVNSTIPAPVVAVSGDIGLNKPTEIVESVILHQESVLDESDMLVPEKPLETPENNPTTIQDEIKVETHNENNQPNSLILWISKLLEALTKLLLRK